MEENGVRYLCTTCGLTHTLTADEASRVALLSMGEAYMLLYGAKFHLSCTSCHGGFFNKLPSAPVGIENRAQLK